MIEALPGFPDNTAAFACRGHVTREDYDRVLVPLMEAKFHKYDKLRLYYEIGPDFDEIDAGAVWEDFKVGMGHFTRWERIAVVTDVDWIKNTMRFFGFLMPAEMKIFRPAEAKQAREWILGKQLQET